MFADLLFPKACVSCGAPKTLLCRKCITQVPPWNDLVCPYCLFSNDTGLCLSCQKKTYLHDILIATDYDTHLVKKALHAYKYDGIRGLAIPLAHFLLPHVENVTALPFVSVPMHPRRKKQRGFDHLALLLDHLSQHAPIDRWQGLERIKYHKPLMGKTAEERKKEIHGAFRVASKPPPRIVLVDDVMSSGATLEECAKMLTFAGCDAITALVLARKR